MSEATTRSCGDYILAKLCLNRTHPNLIKDILCTSNTKFERFCSKKSFLPIFEGAVFRLGSEGRTLTRAKKELDVDNDL